MTPGYEQFVLDPSQSRYMKFRQDLENLLCKKYGKKDFQVEVYQQSAVD